MHEAPARRRGHRRNTPRHLTVIPGGRRQRAESSSAGTPALRSPPLVVLVLGCETLLFGGLLAIAVTLRVARTHWPSPALPTLPVTATVVYTAMLLLSAIPLRRAMRAARAGRRSEVEAGLAATVLLGFAFVAGQAAELVWLSSAGLAPAADSYAATFVALVVGTGGHVLCGVLWMVAAATAVGMGDSRALSSGFLRSGATFWYYGCALWVPVFLALCPW